MIDEFQDTDGRQWDIFRHLFGDSGRPRFLIGDPKQSIYGFRGADLEVYLAARQDVTADRRFLLTTNYRSVPEVVLGGNRLFRGLLS